MFASKIAKPQTKAPAGRSTLAAQLASLPSAELEQEPIVESTNARDAPRPVGWSFCKLPPFVDKVVRAPGHPLDPSIRAFVEQRFDHDLSQVQVHTGEDAARSAEAIGAKAYTVGTHIAFAKGRYEPATPLGMKLLAHELAHVAQQRASPPRPGVGATADAHERHAKAVAETVAHGGMAAALVQQAPRSPPVLQRAPEDQADSPEQLRLPPKGINPEVELPRSPMETAKLAWATGHQVITFILGPDSDKFYKAAHEYWRQPGRTNVLVTNQRTLTGVLNYLNSQKTPNGRSWGQINLVTHANEEGGMGIKLSEQSPNNMSPEELEEKVKAGALPKVDGSAIDSHTAINVHGCAIGRSSEMLKELSQAFSGGAANVYGPKDLQGYKFSGRGKSEKTEEFLVEYWAVGFPAKQARSRKQLVEDLNTTYGAGPGIDWGKAIAHAQTKTMPYHYKFSVGNFTHVPAKGDLGGHRRLLSQVPDSAAWVRWSVKDESVTVDESGQEITTIEYNIKVRGDDRKLVDNTYSLTITNPIPSKEQARKDWLAQQIGQDKVAKFSWTFRLRGPPSGQSGDATLSCEGERKVVRIERDLKDPTGAYAHPSREDPQHYGAYKP